MFRAVLALLAFIFVDYAHAFTSSHLDQMCPYVRSECTRKKGLGWIATSEAVGPDGSYTTAMGDMVFRYSCLCEMRTPYSQQQVQWWIDGAYETLFVPNNKVAGSNANRANSCPVKGSKIFRDQMTLGESIPVAGTPIELVYLSDRADGYLASRSGTLMGYVAPNTTSANVTLEIAGQTISASFPATGATPLPFTWNGQDPSGNPIASAVGTLTITNTNSLGKTDYPVSTGAPLYRANPGTNDPFLRDRSIGFLPVNNSAPRPQKMHLGHWSVSLVHYLDLTTSTLVRGDGQSVEVVPKTVGSNYQVVSTARDEVFVFDSIGKHVSTLNGLTGSTKYTFAYNVDGTLSTITDAYSNVTSFSYASGNPTQITAPFGQVTNLTVTAGYLVNVEYPSTVQHQMTYYGTSGLLNTFTKPSGEVSTFTYDSYGRLTLDSSSAGPSVALAQSVNGSVKTTTVTSNVGRISTITTTGGILSKLFKRSEVVPDGRTVVEDSSTDTSTMVQTRYDSSTTALTENDTRFGAAAKFVKADYSNEGSRNRILTRTQAVTLNNPSDPFDIATYTVNTKVNNVSPGWTTVYTGSSKTFTTTSPLGRVSTRTIDPQERTTSIQNASFAAVNLTYLTNGKLSTTSTGTRTTTFTYDAKGFLASITDPLMQSTSFTSDAYGRVLTTTLPDSRVTGFTYDLNGNLTSVIPPNSIVHSITNNLMGMPSAYLAPSLGSGTLNTTYTYNNDRQLTQIVRPSSATINMNYHATKGTLTSITSGASTYSFTYGDDRPSSMTSPDSVGTNMSWSGKFLITSTYFSAGAGSITTQYDAAHRRSSFQIGSGTSYTYTYDNDELLTGVGSETFTRSSTTGLVSGTSLGSAGEAYTYNASYGEVASYQALYSSANMFSNVYTRDALGRIVTRTETVGTNPADVFAYTYDPAGRLTDMTKNSVLVGHYVYDSNSNRTSSTNSAGTFSATYDAQDRLSTYGTKTFSYNLNGERTGQVDSSVTPGATGYTWDAFGNLKQVALPSTTQINYKYDGFNRRVVRLTGTTVSQRYLYLDQLRIAAVLDSAGATQMTFFYGERTTPEYMIKSGTTYKFFVDHVGSVRQVVNVSTGAIAQEITYDEFGRILSDSSPGFQPFGFGGGLYDVDTKLTQFGARWYDAEVGRWLSKDPILFAGGDTNLYGYVSNDPINWADPHGLAKCKFDISLGLLRCASNDGKKSASVWAFSGDLQGGPLPPGHYAIRKVNGADPGTWFIDPGLLMRALYRVEILGSRPVRGGFNIHLPGSVSHGCISAPATDNSRSSLSSVDQLLTEDAGKNELEVVQ